MAKKIMSGKYKFHDPEAIYFVTMTVVDWVDVFTRSIYKDIIVDSLVYSIKNKGLALHAWVIMSNHVHLVVSAKPNHNLSDIFRDLKKFTSKKIVSEIESNIDESRRKWMIPIFKSHGSKNPNNKEVQFWQQDNHPVELDTNEMIDQRLEYLHNNPVVEQIVDEAEHYIYSSAIDYIGGNGMIQVELID